MEHDTHEMLENQKTFKMTQKFRLMKKTFKLI